MSGEDRFEILLTPETGDGVSTHAQKFVDSSPDGLDLVAKNVRESDYSLRVMIHEIIQSELFQSKTIQVKKE